MIWKYPILNEELYQKVINQIGCNSVTAKILINRDFDNIEDINDFLFADEEKLFDPFLLKDMDKATVRINQAIENQENILIYGDYDADGISSISLMVRGLSKKNKNISYYVPNRMEEGYGLNRDGIKYAKVKEVSLIITVDCGITSVNEVDYIKSLGMDIIITDHHEVKGKRPNADAIINPKQENCSYPFKDLAGVGVAYKLLQALGLEDGLLSLAVLGTIADIVPLISENRILVKYGLKEIAKTDNLGIQSLIKIAHLDNKKVDSGDIGFMITPRINAIGRLGDAYASIQMLITENEVEAYEIAEFLDRENKQRQRLEKNIFEEAVKMIEKEFDFENDIIIVINNDSWHMGIVGIVASRIVEKYYKPAIVIASGEDECKGSCRSIKGFNVFEALCSVSDNLIKFGGHEYAAGLSISKDKIDCLRNQINDYAKQNIKQEQLTQSIKIDVEVDFEKISFDLFKDCNLLAPFGSKNARPIFLSKRLNIKGAPKIVGKDHLQFFLVKDNAVFNCIAFKMRNRFDELMNAFKFKLSIDAVYNLSVNEWKGSSKLQLMIKDFKIF